MARVKVTKYAIHIATECVIFDKNLLNGRKDTFFLATGA